MIPCNVWNITILGLCFIHLATHPITSQWFISLLGYIPTVTVAFLSFRWSIQIWLVVG